MGIFLDKIVLFTMFTMLANFKLKRMCKIVLLLLPLFNIFVIKQLLVNIIQYKRS